MFKWVTLVWQPAMHAHRTVWMRLYFIWQRNTHMFTHVCTHAFELTISNLILVSVSHWALKEDVISRGQKWCPFPCFVLPLRLPLPYFPTLLVLRLWALPLRIIHFTSLSFWAGKKRNSHFTLLSTCTFSWMSFGKWLTLYLGSMEQTPGSVIFLKGTGCDWTWFQTQKVIELMNTVCHHYAPYWCRKRVDKRYQCPVLENSSLGRIG